MVEPLKPSLLDTVRRLEQQVNHLTRELGRLATSGAKPRRQTQSVQVYSPSSTQPTGTQAKFIDATASKPLDTTAFRQYLDPTGNIRPYSFLSYLVDNFGSSTTSGLGNIIPPHHDMELFRLTLPFEANQNTSSSSKNVHIFRVANQTQLANLNQDNFPPTRLVATGPGVYLCRAEIDVTLVRTIDSGSNHRAGSVRLIPSGTGLVLLGTGWNRWGRQVTWGSGDNFFSEVPGLWFLWRPTPATNLSFTVSFSNCIEATSTNALGALLAIEIGKAKPLENLNFTGTRTQSFAPSNIFPSPLIQSSTYATSEWDVGPVSPPPE